MCLTRYINNLFAVKCNEAVQVSMKRSDGEIFIARINISSAEEANKVVELFNHFEELRTCSCRRELVCDRHSSLKKI